MSLVIAHREPNIAPIPAGAAIWRTCLREVAFLGDDEPEDPALVPLGQRLVEADAYRLLLEILCGLQSPMLGETQVMGQFKVFLSTLGHDHARISRVGQRLLTDAREVRTRHLQGLGSRSYGSAIRRFLGDCQHAVVIGTGKLAQEVLPFLADDNRSVDQWGRAHDLTTPSPRVTYRSLDGLAHVAVGAMNPVATTLIVAAPAASEVIERVAGRYPSLRRVVDLRAEFGDRAPVVAAPVVTLQDLFDHMRASQSSSVPHVAAARADIVSRSQQYALRDELRPFGWDDLCA